MFWERFYSFCIKNNKKPLNVVKEISVASASITKWKHGTIPNGETLIKISEYFNCSIDYLLGKNDDMHGYEFSAKEKELISRYRNKPEMQSAVDRLLGLDEYEFIPEVYTGKVAALGGDMREINYSAEDLKAIKEAESKIIGSQEKK